MNMKKIKLYIACSLIFLTVACNAPNHKIGQVDKQLDAMELDVSSISDEDWKKLDAKIAELEQHYKENRKDYTDEQLQEIGRLQGRYSRLALKRGIENARQGLKDLNELAKGFLEGFTEMDSTDMDE
jgi:ribosomal protein S15P/S13E